MATKVYFQVRKVFEKSMIEVQLNYVYDHIENNLQQNKENWIFLILFEKLGSYCTSVL